MGGKVYDRRPLIVDRSPAKQLAVEIGKLGKFPTPSEMAAKFAQMLQDYGLAVIEQETGLDLSAAKRQLDNLKLFLGGVDLDPTDFDPVDAALTFIENVLLPTGLFGGANWGELYEKLSGGTADADPAAQLDQISAFLRDNLFGKVSAERLPLVGLGKIRDVATNEFINGDFDGPESLRDSIDFHHDAADGYDDGHPLGSAYVDADGTSHILRSNNIDVQESTIVFRVRVKYAGLVAAAGANAIRVNMAGYQGNTQTVAPYQVAGIASPAGDSPGAAGWDTLLQVTVGPTPANVDNVNFELVVTPDATAGRVKFDKAAATLNDRLPQTYVDGLTDAIASIWDGIAARLQDWNDLLDVFGGFPVGTGSGQLTDVVNRVKWLNPTTGAFDAAQLGNVGAIVLPNGLSQVPTLANLVDVATGALSGQNQVGGEIVGAIVPDAEQVMTNLYNQLAANTRKLQELESQATAASVGGRRFAINFGDYPDGPFPASLFNLTYSGAGTGALVISGGKAQWNTGNNGYRRATMLYPTPTLTSFQIVRGTMSSPPDQGTNVRIWSLGRANAAGTDYVFARGYCTGWLTYKGDIGCVRGGVEYIWAQNIPLTWSLDLRVVMGVGNNARRHMVLSGDTVVWDGIEPADPAKQSLLDVDHMFWGAISETNGGAVPGNVAGASTVDNAPPAVVGTTAKFSRRIAADVTIASNASGVKVPNNFYETVDHISPDLTYTPGSNCRVTVSKQGTYIVQHRAYHGLYAQGTGGHAVIFKNGAVYERGAWGDTPTSFNAVASSTDATMGTFILPLNPGDYIEPGFRFTSSMSNTGDAATLADGSQSFFAVTRVGI